MVKLFETCFKHDGHIGLRLLYILFLNPVPMENKERRITEKHLYLFHDFEQTRELSPEVQNHIWTEKEKLSGVLLKI